MASCPRAGRTGRRRKSVSIHRRVFDITERKVVSLRDVFLIRLDDATRPLTDPHNLTQTAAQLVCEYLEVDRCAYADVDDEKEHFM